MESSPQAWIGALRHSHDALRATVEPLDEARLRQQSYASEWSIAQVLSHLGSGAEIFGLFLDAGLSGAEPPGGDTFPPIWLPVLMREWVRPIWCSSGWRRLMLSGTGIWLILM